MVRCTDLLTIVSGAAGAAAGAVSTLILQHPDKYLLMLSHLRSDF